MKVECGDHCLLYSDNAHLGMSVVLWEFGRRQVNLIQSPARSETGGLDDLEGLSLESFKTASRREAEWLVTSPLLAKGLLCGFPSAELQDSVGFLGLQVSFSTLVWLCF